MPERPDTGGFSVSHAPQIIPTGGNSEDVNSSTNLAFVGGMFKMGDITFGPVNINVDGFPNDPINGEVVFNTTDGKLYYYDASADAWTAFSVGSGGSGTGLFVGIVGYDASGTTFYYWDGSAWQSISISTAPDTGEIRINSGVLEYWDGSAWQNLASSLPTTDPGSGGLWLSAT